MPTGKLEKIDRRHQVRLEIVGGIVVGRLRKRRRQKMKNGPAALDRRRDVGPAAEITFDVFDAPRKRARSNTRTTQPSSTSASRR